MEPKLDHLAAPISSYSSVFPAFSLEIREWTSETGSLSTDCSAI
jgi:hypothetical protein